MVGFTLDLTEHLLLYFPVLFSYTARKQLVINQLRFVAFKSLFIIGIVATTLVYGGHSGRYLSIKGIGSQSRGCGDETKQREAQCKAYRKGLGVPDPSVVVTQVWPGALWFHSPANVATIFRTAISISEISCLRVNYFHIPCGNGRGGIWGWNGG